MEKILLLGTGYIGSAVYFYLNKDYEINAIDLEWRGNPGKIIQQNRNYNTLTHEELQKYNIVILLAAHSSAPACQQDTFGAFENNVTNFVNLVKKMNDLYCDQKLIYASSSCVYTNKINAKEYDALLPVDSLSFTKNCIDNFITTFYENNISLSFSYYGLRFGSVCGPSPNFREDLAVNAMTKSALQRGYLTVSNGKAHRPFLGMNDLCRAIKAILKGGISGIYNVASFNSTFREVGEKISGLTGCKIENKDGFPTYDFTINTDKFCEEFNFEFKDTIEGVVDEIRKLPDLWS